VAGRPCQQGDTAHEGAADTEDVNVHEFCAAETAPQ
jgi:hypothetical protein